MENFSPSQPGSGLGNFNDKEKLMTGKLSFCLSVTGLTCCLQDLLFVAGGSKEAAVTVQVDKVT